MDRTSPSEGDDVGSIPAEGTNEDIRLYGEYFHFISLEESNWKRGRENGSFPMAEILKPLGFRERANASDVRFFSRAQT